MSQADESRLEIQVGARHHDSRPYHFPSLNQDDRIRRVFGLTDGVSLPSVSNPALAMYYDYLAASLSLPFEALYSPTTGEIRQLIHYVRVVELTDPSQSRNHNLFGLFCKAYNTNKVLDLPLAALGVRDDNPNCQLIDDYAYWFVNRR